MQLHEIIVGSLLRYTIRSQSIPTLTQLAINFNFLLLVLSRLQLQLPMEFLNHLYQSASLLYRIHFACMQRSSLLFQTKKSN